MTGVDLSPIQPHWIPSNVEFIVDDIEDEWIHASDYDFAHFRFVNTLLKDNMAMLNKVFACVPLDGSGRTSSKST